VLLLSITGCFHSSFRPFLSSHFPLFSFSPFPPFRSHEGWPARRRLGEGGCALTLLLLLVLSCLLCLLAACTLFERTVGPDFMGPPAPTTSNQQPTTSNITYSVNPTLASGLDTAKEVAGLLPSPWGEIATAALGLTSGVLGWIARRKTRMVNAMITGVEAAAVNEQVKVSIQKSATAVGVERTLRRHVKRLTEGA
jgi:hypothetical protein